MSDIVQNTDAGPEAITSAPQQTINTTCCIVGGGPAGAFLSLLLARQGIQVMLLEAHNDFDRDFRGDTIHPAILEIMHDIGLAQRLLELPHTKAYRIQLHTKTGTIIVGDFTRLRSRYPYEMLLPQVDFLNFITQEAKKYPNFQLIMGARVEQLLEDDDTIQGVIFRTKDGMTAVRAELTVATDGRFSRVRRLAHLEPIKMTPAIDFLWFNLPHYPHDPRAEAVELYQGGGLFSPLVDRGDYWQVGCVISKGNYKQVRDSGIEAMKQAVTQCVPWFADRINHLQDWKQLSLLSVEANRLLKWYRPGLLIIGDAAHAVSPIGGVGINLAIQDAVAAANHLVKPLKKHKIRISDLAAIQRSRSLRTRIILRWTGLLQDRLGQSLNESTPFPLPPIARLALKLPFIGTLPGRLTAFGGWREHVYHRKSVNLVK